MPADDDFLVFGGPQGTESIDPVAIGRAFVRSLAASCTHPIAVARAVARYEVGLLKLARNFGDHLITNEPPDSRDSKARDRRFADATWKSNPLFFGLQQLYLLNVQLLDELLEAAGSDDLTTKKAKFAAGLLSDATAPTNFLLTNPTALIRAFETGGTSLLRGAANFVDDVLHNKGWPAKVDRDAFVLGKDLAATAGEVVFRNNLIELIQYAPRTESVYDVPLLMCPPWINRYYIMDLAPKRSLIEWAIDHGFTTFAISYRNPDTSMAGTTFDDYLFDGPLAALEVVREITGAPQVHTASVCLGGTLSVAAMAYLCGEKDANPIKSATLLNSLVDHEEAGVLSAVFMDEETVAKIERRMARHGYLEADSLAQAFDLLRANDLIFKPLISRWLLGEKPAAFDILAWNAEGTRLPATMHSFYLRRLWLDNELALDKLELGGRELPVSKIETDTYIVGAVEDHIVPWRSSYKTTQLLAGPCRFVLSSSGHVAGIVNPPNPKARFWVNEANPPSPEQWHAEASEVADTWWNDWISWLIERSGPRVPPPAMGSDVYPAICPAPGIYVRDA